MSSYVSSNQNRFYCGIESTYGAAPTIGTANRLSAVKLTARQEIDVATRKDKTGSRTFAGVPFGTRRKTNFSMKTYLSPWSGSNTQPGCGPLIEAALGGVPLASGGGTVSSVANGTHLTFSAPHGLTINQALAFNGELRFVASVLDSSDLIINAPFTVQPTAGSQLSATITYLPATELPSVSIFDYWSPNTAVQRVLVGAAINELSVNVNGDYHEFEFDGIAKDMVDSSSFSSGEAGLTAFPVEPGLGNFDLTVVPGNLGQVWIGTTAQQFRTLTSANVRVRNNLDTRTREFGAATPMAVCPGERIVLLDFSLFEKDDAATTGLYQAARQRSPISVMLQLGQAPGQLFAVYLKSVVPELPEFNDSETRLQWRFQKSQAQGTADDEIAMAFA